MALVVFASGSSFAQAYAGPKRRHLIRRNPYQKGDSLMSPAELHADSIVIDGLIIAK
ncbi:MAG: peptidase M19, partial [Pseudomonas shirazensis]